MTAMEGLEQIESFAPDIPRFDDGMVNLQDPTRTMAEAIANEIMDVAGQAPATA